LAIGGGSEAPMTSTAARHVRAPVHADGERIMATSATFVGEQERNQ